MGKDAAIAEKHKAPRLFASINLRCGLESTAATLRTKKSSELTWAYVATTLIDEYNVLGSTPTRLGRSSHNDGIGKKERNGNSFREFRDVYHLVGNDSDIEKSVQEISAYQKPSRLGRKINEFLCDFCGKKEHMEGSCFMNPSIQIIGLLQKCWRPCQIPRSQK